MYDCFFFFFGPYSDGKGKFAAKLCEPGSIHVCVTRREAGLTGRKRDEGDYMKNLREPIVLVDYGTHTCYRFRIFPSSLFIYVSFVFHSVPNT